MSVLPMSVFAAEITNENNTTDLPGIIDTNENASIYAVGEDLSLRTANTKHIRMSDGSYYVAMYDNDVHYLNDENEWEEINNTLISSSASDEEDIDGVATSKGKTSVKFANNSSSSKLISIKNGNYKISFGLVGANKAKVITVSNPEEHSDDVTELERLTIVKKAVSSVIYTDILDNIDLEYVVIGNDIKENIIVKEKSNSYIYEFDMKLNKLTAEMLENGTIALKDDKNGDVVFVIDLPYMMDSNGEYSTAVTYSLEQIKNKEYRITINADSAWMNDESRAFPVTIDPPISAGGFFPSIVDDTHVKSGYPTSVFNTEGFLYTGYDSSANKSNVRLYWKLRELPELPSNSVIIDAELSLGQRATNGYSAVSSAQFLTLAIRKVTSAWDVDTMSWNTQPTLEDEIYDYQNTNADYNGAYLTWDITPIVKDWYSGEANNGVCIYPDIEYDGTQGKYANARFVSCNMQSYQMLAPIFTIQYRNTVGLEDYYTYQSQNIGRAGTGFISDYTSNLTLVNTLLATNSTAMAFNINAVYNDGYAGKQYTGTPDVGSTVTIAANYGNMNLGYGWKLNVQESIATVTFDLPETTSRDTIEVTYLVYNDGDGTDHYLIPTDDTNTEFVDEDGLGLTVTVLGNTHTMLDQQDNQKIFVNGLLYKIIDANGNTIKFIYSTGGSPSTGANRLLSIVQYNNGYQTESSANEIASFAYYSDGSLYCVYDHLDRATIFSYSSNKLTAIQYPDEQVAYYSYESKTVDGVTLPFLVDVYDNEAQYGIDYTRGDNSNPFAVTHIKEYYLNTSNYGQEFSINNIYGEETQYRTSGKDNIYGNTDDLITTYLFDFAGHTINVATTDITLKTVYGADTVTYTPEDSASKKRNRMSSVGTIGVAPKNLLIDSSFERTDELGQNYFWNASGIVSGMTEASLVTAVENTKARTGYAYASLTSDSNSSSEVSYSTTGGLIAGTTYTFSAYVDISALSSSSASGGVYLKATSSNNSFIGDKINTDLSSDIIGNKWQRISVTFTPTISATFTLSCCLSSATGTVYFDDCQLEKTDAPSAYNIVNNGSMNTSESWYVGTDANSSFATLVTDTYSHSTIRLDGKLTETAYSFQNINVNKSSNTTFILSGWSYGHSVALDNPKDFNNEPVRFCLSACIVYSDGLEEDHYINFNPDIVDKWQYTSGVIVPERTDAMIDQIVLYLNYGYNANEAYFRDISLVEEEVQTYHYDDNGNLLAATQTDNSTINSSYDDYNNLISQSQDGTNFTYEYPNLDDTDSSNDGNGNIHLPISVTNDGVKMSFTYDSAGNVTGTTVEDLSNVLTTDLISETVYTSNGNLVSSVTDSNGITTRYTYNDRNLLSGVTNAKFVLTEHDYNASNDRPFVSYISGLVSVHYNYLKGELSSIVRGGYIEGNSTKQNQTYTLSRDGFGNLTSVSVGNYTLVTYEYGSYNGQLMKTIYGNGDYIENVYDDLNRIVQIKINGTVKYNYTYSGNGDLYSVEDIDNNITEYYNYDSLDRLISSSQKIGETVLLLTQYDYDNKNRISVYHCGLSGAVGGTLGHTYCYTYDEADGNLTSMSVSGNNINGDILNYQYDPLKRLSEKSIAGQRVTFNQKYSYKNLSSSEATMQISSLQWYKGTTEALSYSYLYDAIGNITHVYKDNSLIARYTYDEQSQLLTEILYDSDIWYEYTYDTYGNIRSVNKYQYSTNTLLDTEMYSYTDSTWLDKLTAYDGVGITYDAIGNPLSYYNGASYTFSWANGRELASVVKGGVTTSYKYDAGGYRIQKTYGSTVYNYYYSDGMLVRMAWLNSYIDFLYDENGSVYSIVYDGDQYYFLKNQQGDVVQILSVWGTKLVEYSYDAWGNCYVVYSHSSYGDLAEINPIRYRSYFYDFETGFYYLQNRYYDPSIGRFINADDAGMLGATEDILSYNLFAYCMNNPVNQTDDGGMLSSWAKKLIIGTAVIAAAAVLTVATAGTGTALACFAVGALKGAVVGAAVGAASGAASGAVTHRLTTGSWNGAGQAALEGAADGYMSGAISGFISGGLTSNSCFVAGTAILTSAGYVAIETIQAGDKVYAHNPDTGETALKEVVQTFVNEADELIHITVNGEEIITTNEHPFYVPVKGWTAACQLRAGDRLQLVNGEYVVVEQIQHEILEAPIKVYNFEVEDFHTYYVGEQSVLVHNLCTKNTTTKWDINKYSKGSVKTKYNGSKMKAQFDGKYYWLEDKAGHGGSAFKVFKQSGNKLEWIYDADEFGNFIIGKHKGPVGLILNIGW